MKNKLPDPARLDALIFDLDGTLWDPSPFVSRGWQKALQQLHPAMREDITAAEMRSYMGMPIDRIGELMFPALSGTERSELVERCVESEHNELHEIGDDRLFPQVRETLHRLSQHFELAIASNCEIGYIENFLERCQLEQYFSDFESWGRTGKSKGDNIRLLMERNCWENACMVGDTDLDQDAAAVAGIPFVLAGYGFGHVHNSDYTINAFAELLPLLGIE